MAKPKGSNNESHHFKVRSSGERVVVNFIVQYLMVGQVRGVFTNLDGTLAKAEDSLQSTFELNTRTVFIKTNHKIRDA